MLSDHFHRELKLLSKLFIIATTLVKEGTISVYDLQELLENKEMIDEVDTYIEIALCGNKQE